MMVCMSEATTNAIKHAGSGMVSFFRLSNRVQVHVEDHGKGIDFSELPKSTLLRGYSSKVSLGMGYTIMLELMDKVYLLTSSQGTTVIIDMEIQSGENPALPGSPDSEGTTAAV